jgi:hypothetical protein
MELRSSGCLVRYRASYSDSNNTPSPPRTPHKLLIYQIPVGCLPELPASSNCNDDVYRRAVRRYWRHCMHSSWNSGSLLRRRHSRRHEPPQEGRGEVSYSPGSRTSRLLIRIQPRNIHVCRSRIAIAPSLTACSMAINFKDGVILAADSRTTTGAYIANRVTDKLTQVHDTIWCCRSGSAADTQAVADIVQYHLGMYGATNDEPPTTQTAAALFQELCYSNKDQLS